MRRIGLLCPLAALVLCSPAALGQEREELKRARADLRRGEYGSAERLYERLVLNRPASWDLRAGLIRACLEQGKREAAERTARGFLKSSPDHAGARAALAHVLLLDGQPGEAIDLLPDASGARERLLAAQAFLELDRIADAVRRTEPLVEVYNQRRDDLMKEELFALEQGLIIYARYSGNSEVYKQVVQNALPDLLRADPGDAAVRAFQGECYLEKYNQAAAAEAFAEALQANPHCVPALLGQARLLLLAHDPREALALLRRAEGVNPTLPETFLLKSEALLAQKDREGALRTIQEGLRVNPGSIRLRSRQVGIRYLLGEAGYEDDVRKTLKTRPLSPWPYWEVARTLLVAGERRFEEVHAFLKLAVGQAPDLPELKIDFGQSCLRVGDEEAGRRILEQAYKADPFNVRVTNAVNLFRDFDRDFDVFEAPHFRVRIVREERRWLEPPVRKVLARAWEDMTRRYGYSPADPVLVEVFTHHSDFSVRTTGVDGLGALGACFGRVVTTLAPRSRIRGADLPPYSWSAVLWHEMAHVFALQLSKYRVAPWFTEGLSTYEEGLASPPGRRGIDLEILWARRRGQLEGVAGLESSRPAQNPVLEIYLQGAMICAFLAETRGFETLPRLLRAYAEGKDTAGALGQVLGQSVEEFDKAFFAWLDRKLSRYKYRFPPKESRAELLADVTARPKDAGALARLAHALLAVGDEKGAEPFAQRAVEADPTEPEARAAYGLALFRRHEFEGAVAQLRGGTDDFQNWDTLGRALSELERWPEAAAAFRKAIACGPGLPGEAPSENVFRRLNAALLASEDSEGALQALVDMVAADPLDYRNRIKLARIFAERGATDRVEGLLRQAGELETRDLAFLDLWALLYRARKQYAPATEATLQALALLDADSREAEPREKAERLCAIGEDWLAQGQKARAEEYAQEALRLVSGLERARKLYEASRLK
jgi:predicted Zn-dependent protease